MFFRYKISHDKYASKKIIYKKAEKYYHAMLKYPVLTGFNLINPFSGYRSNILEKEARQASKSKTGKIAP